MKNRSSPSRSRLRSSKRRAEHRVPRCAARWASRKRRCLDSSLIFGMRPLCFIEDCKVAAII
jgi:hypothetical protein